MIQLQAKPFIKFAGGKTQLLEQFAWLFPRAFKDYYEPFVGGGAVFWSMPLGSDTATISDANAELITTYQVVRDNVRALIATLKEYAAKHSKDFYYSARELEPTTPTATAARFIYLNRTCFNGLYRVNAKGKFNVPMGRYATPNICDAENLYECSYALQRVTITHSDFRKALTLPKEADFVYLDPPYVPLSKTSNFTSYTAGGFTPKDQEDLAAAFKSLTERGVMAMLSNADTPEVRELYKGFDIQTVSAKRAINCQVPKRGAITEVVVRNYT